MISVIVPAYNAARTIGDCVRSLQWQSLARDEYEIIVVDDASQDETPELARALGAQVLQQPHKGPAAARNLGMSAASGDVYAFTDADCAPAADWLAQMRDALSEDKVVAVKGAYATRQTEHVARLAQLEFEERYERLSRFRFIDFFDTYALALRRSALEATGSFDPFFFMANNEDVDLAYRLESRGYRIVFAPRAIVYHGHPASWLRYARQKFWRGYWRMHVYGRYPAKMVRDSYTPQNLKAQMLITLALLSLIPLAPFWAPAAWAALALLVLLEGSALSLYRLAWKRERALLPWIPLFVVWRALALTAGSVLGALTVLRIVPLVPRPFRYGQSPGE